MCVLSRALRPHKYGVQANAQGTRIVVVHLCATGTPTVSAHVQHDQVCVGRGKSKETGLAGESNTCAPYPNATSNVIIMANPTVTPIVGMSVSPLRVQFSQTPCLTTLVGMALIPRFRKRLP